MRVQSYVPAKSSQAEIRESYESDCIFFLIIVCDKVLRLTTFSNTQYSHCIEIQVVILVQLTKCQLCQESRHEHLMI